jgi:hypothetical protein
MMTVMARKPLEVEYRYRRARPGPSNKEIIGDPTAKCVQMDYEIGCHERRRTTHVSET